MALFSRRPSLPLTGDDYRQLFESAFDAMLVFDAETELVLEVNARACELYGFTRQEMLGMNLTSLTKDVEGGREKVALILEGTGALQLYTTQFRKDGSEVHLEVCASKVSVDGRVAILTANRDITGRRKDEVLIQSSERKYRQLFERNLAGVFRNSLEGRILDCNEACVRILGLESREEAIGRDASELYFEPSEREALMKTLTAQRALTNIEVRMRRLDGREIFVLENVSLVDSGDGELVVEGTMFDITERKEAEKQVAYQAYHDPLTGLGNRKLFELRLVPAISQARREGYPMAVLFVDLDRFKSINDSMGHGVGDEILRQVCFRMAPLIRAEDSLARVGGDEFTVMLSRISGPHDAMRVAQKLLETIANPYQVGENAFFVTASIGIAMFPSDGDSAETLIKNADSAMFRAKELGRNGYQLCTGTIAGKAMERLLLEVSLRSAIDNGELHIEYQPQVDLAMGRVVGVEALLRWRHPQRGPISPATFIPIAENSGLILQIGEWVLRKACEQLRLWHLAGHEGLRMAVNLSAGQFQQPELLTSIRNILRDTQLDPRCLELEITESTAMQNTERTIAVLNRLKEMGIRIAIDDFGTGHSSLNYLKRFPLDVLKIDQSFVRDIMRSGSDAAIVLAVIAMARGVNLELIAEGVETEEQKQFLLEHGCQQMQGYFFSRPLPTPDVDKFLRAGAWLQVAPAQPS